MTKTTKLNRATLDALERHLPLYLITGWGEIEARAQTKLYENGTERSRLLHRGNVAQIINFCDKVFAAGGVVNIDDLPWLDIKLSHHHYGWSAELEPQCAELRTLWSKRDRTPYQPQW